MFWGHSLTFLYLTVSMNVDVTWGGCSPPGKLCEWVYWNEWSHCSASCGGGHRSRTRAICCVENENFQECYDRCGLTGDSYELGDCNTQCYNGGTYVNYCRCTPGFYGSCCSSVITCGPPSAISHGSLEVTKLTYDGKVTYSCDTNYKLVDGDHIRTCEAFGSMGMWSGKIPRCAYMLSCGSSPCKNGGTCTNIPDSYTCACPHGWSGTTCEIDTLPPEVEENTCSPDLSFLTSDETKSVTWQEPNIYDPHGGNIILTSNVPHNQAELQWGDHVIQYTGRKTSNGLLVECTFTIRIDPHPCPPLTVPGAGALVCNGWYTRFANVCVIMCPEDKNVPAGIDIGQLKVCSASGVWLPNAIVPDCSEPRIATSESIHHYVGTCNSNHATIQKNYISALTSERSTLTYLCYEFINKCMSENVHVVCDMP